MKPYFNVDQYLHDNKTEQMHNADGGALQQMIMADGGQNETTYRLAQQITKAPAPYVINVTNTTAGNLTCILFGTSLYYQSTNYGSDTGVTVASASTNISYFQMLTQSLTQPFEVGAMRIISSASQVVQTINAESVDSSGQRVDLPIFASIYQSSYQNNSGIVDIDYPFTIDANTSLSFTILAATSAVVIFFPRTKVNQVKTLNGAPAITQYGAAPVTIGVPVSATGFGTVQPGLMGR